LPQIGQVLRHRSQLSTAIYAKVDTARLRDVARPWPGRADRHAGPHEPHRPDQRESPRRVQVARRVAAGRAGVSGHPTGAGVHLGFTLSTRGRLLMDFVAYCDRHAVATVTTDVALAWATGTTRSPDLLWWARRLMVVRIFARYLGSLRGEPFLW
jgi:hypothetical protein